MNLDTSSRARLYITYLKGRSELLLYVRPRQTRGRQIIYRRSPGDAAMSLRVQSLLDQARVLPSELDIWVLLYPPEIQTTTLYTPRGLNNFQLKELIREQILIHLPYSINYDWQNYIMSKRDNGDGTNMVTVSILGKQVIPRVRSLLYSNFSKVSFLGDGLQFLQVNENKFPQTRDRYYQVILPYDEIFYLSGFRGGQHVSSCALTHANSAFFGRYQIRHQQAYLDCKLTGERVDLPRIQPIVDMREWAEELLTPAAFPLWHIACQALDTREVKSFVRRGVQVQQYPDEKSARLGGINRYLD